jgi:biopolymer transport protein ExbB
MPTQEEATSIWFFILKGGPVMIPIIGLSIIALAIILAKFCELWRFRVRLDGLTQRLTHLARDGDLPIALHVCQEENAPVGQLFAEAILYRSLERGEITRRLERLGGEVVASLESYLGALAGIIGVEPMLGFLGTMIGLIRAFMSWEALGERITISLLAGGIYQAMITTAAGLSIAIPYYLVYNHLVTRIKNLTRILEERTEAFIDLLTEKEGKESARHAL